MTHFPWPPTLPMTNFTRRTPLIPLPLKDLSWYLPKYLHLDVLDFLDFAFVLSGIEPENRCLPFYSSSLAVMFL